ncbi:hypothetical protein EYF80_042634 [Liparis tanakae]|uniref:Uncharacterized protein n=1 Tax=Liparis tanakae TaxID=230148 RepID=A0A4Z2G1U5_9TELE|nr:hypothetical protein EYF80_042634 [Liparis tanakae]
MSHTYRGEEGEELVLAGGQVPEGGERRRRSTGPVVQQHREAPDSQGRTRSPESPARGPAGGQGARRRG